MNSPVRQPDPAVLRKVIETRAAQGLPPTVEDPAALERAAAALRAIEIDAAVLLKATKVDGVYDADPATTPHATRYTSLGYADLLRDQLKVMDAAAVSLCMENDLPIVVFDLNAPNNIMRVALGEPVGTRIQADAEGGMRR